jgi:hypothetical protein
MTLDGLLTIFILYVLIPVWLLAGLGDWLCHRMTGMSETAGAKESVIHLLMLFEVGLPLLAGLLFEINALILAFMLFSLILHEITGWWDLQYAHSKRDIKPLEQHIHSFQETIPMMAFAMVSLLHWNQFIALLGLKEGADYSLEWKHNPLSISYTGSVIALAILFEILPFMEEFWRSYKLHGGRLVPQEKNLKSAHLDVDRANRA